MIIKDYDPKDRERLYAIICASLDEMYEADMLYFFHVQWPDGQLTACDFSGIPIGLISSLKAETDHVRIMMFAVDENYRSIGVGSALLTRLKHVAAMQGIRRISLEVRPSNTRAVNFYKRHGFTISETLERYYNDGGDAVRMNWIS
ncbi:MAG: GNAT family N-acetyltransferase [Methanomassiliicoccaceae archaeon]|nr:GNAT family N-acetyltransferase [Methanomassiliicoccaceae archaeon]